MILSLKKAFKIFCIFFSLHLLAINTCEQSYLNLFLNKKISFEIENKKKSTSNEKDFSDDDEIYDIIINSFLLNDSLKLISKNNNINLKSQNLLSIYIDKPIIPPNIF